MSKILMGWLDIAGGSAHVDINLSYADSSDCLTPNNLISSL